MTRDIYWMGSSKKDYLSFPQNVQKKISDALDKAADGEKAANVKPLKGFSGASVLEVFVRDPSGAYRCVYTVKLRTGVYVLHTFQKKSHHDIATPPKEMDMIDRRLKRAQEQDAELLQQQEKGKRHG